MTEAQQKNSPPHGYDLSNFLTDIVGLQFTEEMAEVVLARIKIIEDAYAKIHS